VITLILFCLLLFYGINLWAGMGAGFSWREVTLVFLKILGVVMMLIGVVLALVLIIDGMEKGVLP